MANKTLSQITAATNPPATTDQAVGVGGGSTDYLYTFVQIANTIGPIVTANNANNLGGLAAASYANTSAPVITTTLEVGASGNNVTINTIAINMGNSTVNASINSTIYTGQSLTANNSTNLGGTAASGYQTTAGLSGNVAVLSANNTSYLGGTVAASYANTTNTSATNITAGTLPWAQAPTGTVNTSGNFTMAGNTTFSANVTLTAAGGQIVLESGYGAGGNVIINSTAIYLGNSTANLSLNSTTITIGTETVNSIALVVNSVVANSLTVTNTIQANGSYGTSGYALLSGGSSANIYWGVVAGGATGSNTQIAYNNSGTESGDANLTWNTTTATLSVSNAIFIGNSTVNTTINGTSHIISSTGQIILEGGLGAAGNVIINSTALYIGNSTANVTINSTTSFGGGGPIGSNTQIAYNNSGTESGDANLTWNTTTGSLSVANTLYLVGNSTVNASINTSTFALNSNTAGVLSIGNATVNCTINSTSFSVINSGAYATAVSNGSMLMPGGFIMNWGYVSASSTGTTATFETAYGTNAFFVVATTSLAASGDSTYAVGVTAWTKTGCTIKSCNTAAENIYYFSIGI